MEGDKFNIRSIKSQISDSCDIGFKDFEDIFDFISKSGEKQIFEDHYYNEIILVFEKLVKLDYDSIINENNKFLLTSDEHRKVWGITERNFYYTRMYFDICFATFSLTKTKSNEKSFNIKIGFKEQGFEKQLFPLLLNLMKKKEEDRNHSLIKCIISSVINFMLTRHEDDFKIPYYFRNFFCKKQANKTPYDLFLRLFDDFLTNTRDCIDSFKPEESQIETINFIENFKIFKKDLKKHAKEENINILFGKISNFKAIIDHYVQNHIYVGELGLTESKKYFDTIFAFEEKIREYFSKENYQKHFSGFLNVTNLFMKKEYDIWEFFFMMENSIDIENTQDELLNYFTEVFNDICFKEMFFTILKSECIKSYYHDCEILYECDYEELIAKNYHVKFYDGVNLVPLRPGLNGFTDCTLTTFINNRPRKMVFNKTIKAHKLFKYASLLITMLHESNHFIRRFTRKGLNVKDAKTNRESSYKSNKKDQLIKGLEIEGGENMSKLIFNENLITINIFQILYILDLNNWKQDYNIFRENFILCQDQNDVLSDLNKFNETFKGKFEDEIKELIADCKNKENFTQSITCENSKKKQEYGISLGRCLIGMCRENNPDYNI